jgi:hypothetical protein
MNAATLLYLNPNKAVQYNATTVDAMSRLWASVDADIKSTLLSNVPLAVVNRKPNPFFAVNSATSNFDVIGIDRSIRELMNVPDPIRNNVFVPNVYCPVVVENSNKLVLYDAPVGLERLHLASNYKFRMLFPSGKTRTATINSVTRVGGDVIVESKERDLALTNTVDRQNNAILQGVLVSDAMRIMQIAFASNSSLRLEQADDKFNVNLYKVLYPITQGMTADEAYADYLVHNMESPARIGKTEDIAMASSNMRAVLPYLRVTGQTRVDELKIGESVPIVSVSRDFATEFNFCTDDQLISERAIKTYSDRVRNMTMYTGIADDFFCKRVFTASNHVSSNATIKRHTASNIHASNLIASEVRVTGGLRSSGVVDISGGPLTVSCPSTFSAMLQSTCNLCLDSMIQRCSINEARCGEVRIERLSVLSAAVSNLKVQSALDVLGPTRFDRLLASSVAACNLVTNTVSCERTNTSVMTAGSSITGKLQVTEKCVLPLVDAQTLKAGIIDSADIRTSLLDSKVVLCESISASTDTYSRKLACGELTVDTRSTCRGVTSCNLASSNVYARDLVVEGDVRVTGSLAVTKNFVFPPTSFFSNSNMHTESLVGHRAGFAGQRRDAHKYHHLPGHQEKGQGTDGRACHMRVPVIPRAHETYWE